LYFCFVFIFCILCIFLCKLIQPLATIPIKPSTDYNILHSATFFYRCWTHSLEHTAHHTRTSPWWTCFSGLSRQTGFKYHSRWV